jgi:large repetitive protein
MKLHQLPIISATATTCRLPLAHIQQLLTGSYRGPESNVSANRPGSTPSAASRSQVISVISHPAPRRFSRHLFGLLSLVILALSASSQLHAQSVTYTGSSSALSFGNANVCPSGQNAPAPCSSTLTLTYSVSAGTSIGSVVILTTGATNLDFQPEANDTSTTLCTPRTYSSLTTCTVDVTFTPLRPGLRKGAVQIVSNGGGILATTYIYGTGVGPAITFQQYFLNHSNTPVTVPGGFTGGLAVDASGNLYIADGEVYEVLAVDGAIPANPVIETLSSGLTYANDVAVDGAGNVFVSVGTNGTYTPAGGSVQEILAVDGRIPASPTINTLGSGFLVPYGVAVDAAGDVFVADTYNSAVKEILAGGGTIPADPVINTLGSGFNRPFCVAVDANGNVFVADTDNERVKEIVAVDGSIPANPTINILNSGSYIGYPMALGLDAAGDVYVGTNSGSIQSGEVTEYLAVNGTVPAAPQTISFAPGFNYPVSLAVDGSGNVFVATGYYPSGIEAAYLAVPPTITFPSTLVGNTTGPESVQFQNVGNALLTGSGTLGATPDFSVVASSIFGPANCTPGTISLAPGAACSLSVDFTPQSLGTLTSFLTITDNSLNANSATQTVAFSGVGNEMRKNQTITFNPIGSQTAGTQVALVATASSGLPVTFLSATPAICTISGNTATLLAAGYCNIQANQAGNYAYWAATAGQFILIQHANQTVDFPTIATQTALTPIDHLYATASSGLPVTFTSKTPDVCTISGIKATLLTSGYCDIVATQPGNGEYFAAITGQTFLVHHRSQVITFDAISAQPAGTTLPLTASSDSDLAITYASTTPTVCTVSGSTASLLTAGTCTIQASQAGNATWFPSGPKTVSFTVQ